MGIGGCLLSNICHDAPIGKSTITPLRSLLYHSADTGPAITEMNLQLQSSFFSKFPMELREYCYPEYLNLITKEMHGVDGGLTDLLGGTLRGARGLEKVLRAASTCKRLDVELSGIAFREYYYSVCISPGSIEWGSLPCIINRRIRKLMLLIEMGQDEMKRALTEVTEFFERGARLRELTLVIWSDHLRTLRKDPHNVLEAISGAFRVRGTVNVIDHHFLWTGTHFVSGEQLEAVKRTIEVLVSIVSRCMRHTDLAAGKQDGSEVDWEGIYGRAPSLCKTLNDKIRTQQRDDTVEYEQLIMAEAMSIPSDGELEFETESYNLWKSNG